VIEAVGPGVNGLAPGDHVVLTFDSCGTCTNCLAAHPASCAEFFPRNLTGVAVDGSAPAADLDGRPVAARWFGQSSLASHAIATGRNVVRVDPGLPLELRKAGADPGSARVTDSRVWERMRKARPGGDARPTPISSGGS
jgi:aryl-alcohol dehydrogenase